MFIGDGAKLVRDAFELAKQNAPAVMFIDELDAMVRNISILRRALTVKPNVSHVGTSEPTGWIQQ